MVIILCFKYFKYMALIFYNNVAVFGTTATADDWTIEQALIKSLCKYVSNLLFSVNVDSDSAIEHIFPEMTIFDCYVLRSCPLAKNKFLISYFHTLNSGVVIEGWWAG